MDGDRCSDIRCSCWGGKLNVFFCDRNPVRLKGVNCPHHLNECFIVRSGEQVAKLLAPDISFKTTHASVRVETTTAKSNSRGNLSLRPDRLSNSFERTYAHGAALISGSRSRFLKMGYYVIVARLPHSDRL